MERSRESLVEEVLALRNSDREGWSKVNSQAAEMEKMRIELEWWKKTFGPESTR